MRTRAHGALRFAALACTPVLALALAGCSAVGGLTGAVAGVASGSATANPAVGIAVGIGVKAGVDETINTLLRHWSAEEQARIATQIGAMAVGQRSPWNVAHAVPYDNKKGEVTVVRAFDTPLAACKEAAFTVDDADARKAGAPPSYFITSVCRGSTGWMWALAEPAVGRWGALQ